MNPFVLLVLIALLYVLIVGGLAALRREGLSLQFAAEILVTTAVLIGLSLLVRQSMSPILFLALLYLVTMRIRLLVDLANQLARRNHHTWAARLYELALRLRPDPVGRLIARLNQSVHRFKQGEVAQAAAQLEGLLPLFADIRSPKYEAAVRFNLAVAYQRRGDDTKAVVEFNKVIDMMPGSLYALGAQKALERGRRKDG